MHQETLPFGEEKKCPPSIEERFQEWMEGPGQEVYRHFVAIAERLKGAGRERLGAKAIAEVIRYERAISGKDCAGYKLNNVFVALLSRRLIAERPEYADYFETRRLRSRGE